MSQSTARRLVVLAGIVMLGSLALKKGGPSFRAVWAAAALVLVLSFFSDFVPTIAGPLALIIALSVGFTQGGLLEWLGNTVGGGSSGASGTATRSGTGAAAPSGVGGPVTGAGIPSPAAFF